jgi:glycosyltransferase involved in cell wall biosynthesis
LNVLIVADVSIAKVIGGAERFLYEQSIRLAQRGHNVHILTRRLPAHKNDHECIHGICEWRYDCQKCNPATFLKMTILNTKKLFEFLHKKHQFEYIIFHQPFSALGVILSKKSYSIPKIYTCHSLSFEEFLTRNKINNGILSTALKFVRILSYKQIEKYALNKSNTIIVLSEFTRNKLSETYNIRKDQIKIIPGGVDYHKFQPPHNKVVIRKQFNIPQDKVIFFTVRNLVQRMGLENLIIAIQKINNKAPDIYMVIGGDGPLKADLVTLRNRLGLKGLIHFRGFISEDHLPTFYQMADLFVLPTKELEGFGLVTLEAMASGLPVVGTPVGGTQEILEKFDSGFLFKGTDPDSIVELLTEKYYQIKHCPKKWQEISHRCRNFVESNYSWDKNIDCLEELIANTLPN